MTAPRKKLFLTEIRRAVADYIATEGCSCCRDSDGHDEAEKVLAELLSIPPYKDHSGFDFYKFRTKQ